MQIETSHAGGDLSCDQLVVSKQLSQVFSIQRKDLIQGGNLKADQDPRIVSFEEVLEWLVLAEWVPIQRIMID